MTRNLIVPAIVLALGSSALAQVAAPPGSTTLGTAQIDPMNRTSTSPGATTLEVDASGQVRREGATLPGQARITGSAQVEVAPRVDVPRVTVPPAGGIAEPAPPTTLDTNLDVSGTTTGATTPGSTSLLTSGLIEGRLEAGTTPDTLFLVTSDGNRFLINDPARVAELRSSLGSTISVTGSVSPFHDPDLPPGLARQETLPPGLQREPLPPGLESRAQTVNQLQIEGFTVLPAAPSTPAGAGRF